MRARVKITPREKRRHFLAWGDFHARSRFARSTIPEEKWGTTRSQNRMELKQHSCLATLHSPLNLTYFLL